MKEASYWESEGDAANCQLCPHGCRIRPGRTGICGVRRNIEGRLIAESYGMASSIHLDPIEKKPLFHFRPGQDVLSFGSVGCNLRCQHCQNFSISQATPHDIPLRKIAPDEVPGMVRQSGSKGVAWTYNEPTMWYEFAAEASKLCKDEGQFTVFVTNGFIQERPLRDLAGVIDAMNIDVKGFTERFYHDVCKARLQEVLRTCEVAKEIGIHVELTYLIIPSWNDSEAEIRSFTEWVGDRMGVDTPLHFSRFHPDYLMTELPPTPMSTMEMAYETAKNVGLEYVFLGNVLTEGKEDTYCPKCGSLLIRRSGFNAKTIGLKGVNCIKCGRKQSIVL